MNDKETRLLNVPKINDTKIMIDILKEIGVKVKGDTFYSKKLKTAISSDNPSKIRASYYLMGALISKCGYVKIKHPGGCKIGDRGINYHLEGFKRMGIKVAINDFIILEGRSQGGCIDCLKSVGATINFLLASTNALKITKLINPAKEPEVLDVINYLQAIDYKIIISDEIIIHPKSKGKSISYQIIPDRIEALTFMTLGLLNGNLKIYNANHNHIESVINLFKNNNGNVQIKKNYIHVKKSKLKELSFETGIYPNIPTDIQQILTVAALFCKKKSVITDNIYVNRFSHCEELKKMGANIIKVNNTITVYPSSMFGSYVVGNDLRGTAALAIAGLVVKGKTKLSNTSYLERGYEDFVKKIKKIGGKIIIHDN